jgi:D-amino-acid oxidase
MTHIKKMTPPRLAAINLGQEILCYRPLRLGSPRLELESSNGRLIVHNYGHGGSGWTLGPGCSEYAVHLLNSEISSQLKKKPIAVIGAGALGFFSAIELLRAGFSQISIVAENFEDLTSHQAGGLLALSSVKNEAGMTWPLEKISVDSFLYYQSIFQGKHPHFRQGARKVPAYFGQGETALMALYSDLKLIAPSREIVLDFGNRTRQTVIGYDDGIFIDTQLMMVQMKNFLLQAGVVMKQKKLKSFSELSEELVINCSGLGACDLNGDTKLVPVQGHLILLKDQVPTDLEYMIDFGVEYSSTSSGIPLKRSFYMFPKRMTGAKLSDVGVIGGTFIEGADGLTPHLDEFPLIIERARAFFGV